MLTIFAIGYALGILATLLLIGLLRAAKQSSVIEDTPRTRIG
jgi:hypothetical protein